MSDSIIEFDELKPTERKPTGYINSAAEEDGIANYKLETLVFTYKRTVNNINKRDYFIIIIIIILILACKSQAWPS